MGEYNKMASAKPSPSGFVHDIILYEPRMHRKCLKCGLTQDKVGMMEIRIDESLKEVREKINKEKIKPGDFVRFKHNFLIEYFVLPGELSLDSGKELQRLGRGYSLQDLEKATPEEEKLIKPLIKKEFR